MMKDCIPPWPLTTEKMTCRKKTPLASAPEFVKNGIDNLHKIKEHPKCFTGFHSSYLTLFPKTHALNFQGQDRGLPGLDEQLDPAVAALAVRGEGHADMGEVRFQDVLLLRRVFHQGLHGRRGSRALGLVLGEAGDGAGYGGC